MSSGTIDLGATFGSGMSWKSPVAVAADLPANGNANGDARIDLSTDTLYVWNGTAWIAVATPGAAIAIDGLISDVSASGPGVVAATVNSVGGSSAANIHSAELLANAATDLNTASTIVKRDASGNFSAGAITLSGALSASNFSGSSSGANTGDVTLGSANGLSLSGQSLSLQLSDATHIGALSSTDWNTFNNKGSGTVTSVDFSTPGVIFSVSGNPITTSGTIALGLLTQSANTVFAGPTTGAAAAPAFRSLVAADLPAISLTSGVSGILPIANGGTGQSTANTALNALLPDQSSSTGFFLQTNGSNTSWVSGGLAGTMPSAHLSSTSASTSATTTYVTAISTTIAMTATSAPIHAIATGVFTVTSAVPTVMKYRVSINGVAGQEQLLSLTALTTNYTAAVQYLSAAVGPGTYTILFEFARNSGTGTVNFFEGTLDAVGLQGANTNGITQLTGDVTTPAGSGAQAATIANAAVTGAKIASATITAANIASATITTTQIAANTILNANISTVDTSKITTGTLGFARGGTGATTFANQRIPFSNGTVLTSDAKFLYDTTNTRFSVGGTGTAVGNFVNTGSQVALQAFNQGTNNAFQALNQSAFTISMVNRSNSNVTGASISGEFGRGTLAVPLQALSGDQLFSVSAQGYTGAVTAPGFTGAISFVAAENVTATACGGDVVISSTPNTTLIPIERLRIKQSGESVFSAAIAAAQMTTATKTALTAVGGWVVFDTDLNQLSYYNGTIWINL